MHLGEKFLAAIFSIIIYSHVSFDSLSDTAETRYAKLRKNVTQSTVCQVGMVVCTKFKSC